MSFLGRIGGLVAASLVLALATAPGAVAALPAGYVSAVVDNPSPNSADAFGSNMVNAGDVNGDGVDDLLVGMPDSPDPGNLPSISGKVVFVNGRTGEPITTVRPPTSDTLLSHEGLSTDFGAQVATIGDLDNDGLPEHAVSAPGSDISASAVDMGIVYVLNGQSHAVMKRIQLAPDDRPASPPGFGKALAAPGGQPACAGFGGTAACPEAPSSLVARGDLDGGGEGDLVIGAPDYEENGLSGPVSGPGLGRVYVISGERINSSAASLEPDPGIPPITYFDQATAGQQPRLGATVSPIGDVGSCVGDLLFDSNCLSATSQYAPSNAPDGYPDYVVGAPGLGDAFIVDGRRGLLIARLASPDPQAGAGFGSAPARPAPGNIGASGLPDAYVAATGQDLTETDQGRAFLFTGDVTAPGSFGHVDDPTPLAGGGFGTFAGLGDVTGEDSLNEYAIGRLGGGPVRIMSACGPTLVQTIPDAEPGARFGAALVPMGDLNDDGYIDLAVGAPAHANDAGRVYLLRSNGGDRAEVSCAPPDPGPGSGGEPGDGTLPDEGGDGDPGDGPPGTGRKISTLAKRTITLSSPRKVVKVSSALTLSGRLKAPKRKALCERKQKVAIQRFAGKGFWQTIDVAVSRRDGRFGARIRLGPAQNFTYRARVNQTRRCMAATSNKVRIKAVN